LEAGAWGGILNLGGVGGGGIKRVRPLVKLLVRQAPGVRLHTMQVEARQLKPWLESGKLDFAMGSFPSLTKGVRRQFLWTETYVGVVRSGHPRLRRSPPLAAFPAEKELQVS